MITNAGQRNQRICAEHVKTHVRQYFNSAEEAAASLGFSPFTVRDCLAHPGKRVDSPYGPLTKRGTVRQRRMTMEYVFSYVSNRVVHLYPTFEGGEEQEYFSVHAAAKALGVGKATFYRHIEEGQGKILDAVGREWVFVIVEAKED